MKKYKKKAGVFLKKNYRKKTFLQCFFCTIKSTNFLATHTNHTSHFVLNIIELSFYWNVLHYTKCVKPSQMLMLK